VLSVNEDPSRGFYVRGATEHVVTQLEEILKYIEKGESNRKYATTAMNHHSSRSHTIFRLKVTSVQIENSEENPNSITTESTLNFVDLAGSERVSSLQDVSFEAKHKNNRSRENLETLLTEGKHINTSLFYLCQVINKLSEKTSNNSDSHIPYRNSNLTKILRSSLGGNSLTCIICTAVPTLSQFEMTLSTLRFGGIAKTITNNVEANIKSNHNAEILQAYQKDLEALRRELDNAQQGGKAKVEEALSVRKQLEERIARLTQMLFNQSRQNHIAKNFDEYPTASKQNLWCSLAGDLIVDSKLGNSVDKNLSSLKFDQKGAFAFERMRTMNLDIKKKEQEIGELKECKQSLLDSKINLKNDLKQALNLCQQLSFAKLKYLDKYKKLKGKCKLLQEKLKIVEKHSDLNKLNDEQLQELENFFFYSLDAVKNAKFRKKYEKRLVKIQQDPIKFESPVSKKSSNKLWEVLGLLDENSLISSGSESSLDFETSFYKNQKPDRDSFTSFVSQDISTLIFENFENKETKTEFNTGGSSSKNVLVPDTYESTPLSELSSHFLNTKKH
jgi:Kinesin motor domain